MPKQKNNIVMKSTRGMFGKQVVFKERAGDGYVAAPPQVNENREPTSDQQTVQNKFKSSTSYASEVIKDPVKKAAYKAKAKRNQSAHNVAFKDAAVAPQVKGIIAQGYQGVVGNIIVVQAQDDFKVAGVNVVITGANGTVIEQGAAVASGTDSLNWTYTATQANATLTGTKITATATDLPGNTGALTVTL